MTLDTAIGILNYSETTGLAEVRIHFEEKSENIQFLADTADDEVMRELYLVQITNLKSAWQLLKSQESDLVGKAKLWEKNKNELLASKDNSLIEKQAEIALHNAQLEWSRQLFTKLSELQPRNDFAFERIGFCNHILSEYKKAERERERLRKVEEIKDSRATFSENEKKEEDWIQNTLLKNNSELDGQLSPWIKSLFFSRENATHISNSKKPLKKEKKEAFLFSSIVLLFAISVLSFSYSNEILSFIEVLNYEKSSDGTVVYSKKDYIKKADDLYVTGNYVKALIQYSLASAIAPEDVYIQEQIAVCKLLIRQNQNALTTNYVSNNYALDSLNNDEASEDNKNTSEIDEVEESLVQQEDQNQNYASLTDTIPNFTNSEDIAINSESQIENNETSSDTVVSIEELDSLLLTDDSTFVANIEVEDIPVVSEIKKKSPKIELNNDDLKHRIIQKANEKLKEDKEFLSKVYLVADKRPAPDGGYENFDEYLRRNMEYPKRAEKNKIEGVVYVQFVVNRDGTISNAKTTTSLGYGLEEEAIRLISEYPSWVPGQIDSREVNVQTSLPIWFVSQ